MINRLRGTVLFDNIALLSLSLVVNVLGFGFQFIMARLLLPPAYAEMFAVLSLLAIVTVPGLALNTLTIKMTGEYWVHGRGEELWEWIVRAALTVSLIGLFLALVLSLFSRWFADLLHLDTVDSILVAGVAIVVTFVVIVVKGSLAGIHSFVYLGLVNVIETAGRLVSGVVFVMLGFAAAGAVSATVVSAVAAILIGGLIAKRSVKQAPAFENMVIKPLPNLSAQLQILIIAFALATMFNIDILFVKQRFSEFEAAEYAAIALLGRTLFFAASPVSVVMLPHCISAFRDGRSLIPVLTISLLVIGLILALIILILVLFPNQIFDIVFGGRYTVDYVMLLTYAIAGSMLALFSALSQLHVGINNLSIWRIVTVLTISMICSMVFFGSNRQDIATSVAVASSLVVTYLTWETVRVLRSSKR